MSRWHDQFNTHAFHGLWGSLKTLLSELNDASSLDEISLSEISRMKKLCAYIEGVIESIEPELFPITQLTVSQKQTQNCINEINQFKGNNNSGHLTNANNYLDAVTVSFAQAIVKVPAKTEKASLLKAANAYNEALTIYLEKLKSDMKEHMDNVEGQAEELSSSISEQETEIVSTNTTLNATQETITTLSAEFQTQFNADQKDRDSKFAEAQVAHQETINTEFKDLSNKAATTLGVLSQYQLDAGKVLGVVVNTAQAGAYKSYANEEKRTANWFRLFAVFLMMLGAAILVAPELIKIFSDPIYVFDWQKALGRFPISLVVFVPAFYLAREAGKHRENEFKSKRRELILSTLDPFLALLDGKTDSKADEIKEYVAKNIFTEDRVDGTKSDDAGTIAQLSNLLKQLKNLGKN